MFAVMIGAAALVLVVLGLAGLLHRLGRRVAWGWLAIGGGLVLAIGLGAWSWTREEPAPPLGPGEFTLITNVEVEVRFIPNWPILLGTLIPLAGLGLVVALTLRRQGRPIARAVGLANAGDLAGAIAIVRGRFDARREVGVAVDPGVDPWAPPAAALGGDDPALAAELNLLATFEGMRGDWAEALRWATEARQAGGDQPRFLVNQSKALIALGRPDEGLATVRRVLDGAKDDDPAGQIPLLALTARALLDLGRPAEATAALDRADALFARSAIGPTRLRRSLRAAVDLQRGRLAAADLAAGSTPP